MAEVSRQVLASLLVLFIVVSIVGTWSTLTYLTSVPAQAPIELPVPEGRVSMYVQGELEPVSTGGMIRIYVP